MTHESNGVLERETPCKWSFELWIKKYNLVQLQEILFENGLNSLNKCLSFARASDVAQRIKSLFNKDSNKNNMRITHQDLINCEYAFNSLLKLQQTDDFLVFLNKLSKIQQNSKTRKAHGKNSEWTLIFVDCDDVKSLLDEKKIKMINVENSINLLQATIYRIIDNSDNKKNIAGYHLGGDLFALFVHDNHGMTKSIQIVKYLIKIMSNTVKSSLTISCGIGIRRMINDDMDIRSTKKKEISTVFNLWSIMHEKIGIKGEKKEKKDSFQREWVLRAHINLLRAKENGKNCYFYQLEKIDTSKNNQDLDAMCKKMHHLLKNGYVKESESLYYDILSKFDENTILNQAITTQTAPPLFSQMASMIFSRKQHIGNAKYRSYAATKHTKRSLKTFLLGKMSIECYYCYKSWQCEYGDAMGVKQTHSSIEDKQDNTECDTTEYDITQLTRQRTADPVILPVEKKSALYWIKLAWEHLSDLSHSSRIVYGFLYEIGLIDKAFDYFEKLSLEMVKIYPKHGGMRCCLGRRYYDKSMFTKAFDIFEQAVIDIPDSTTVLSNVAIYYLNSCMLGKKWESTKYTYTPKQRAERSLKYSKQLMQLASQGKYVRSSTYWRYGKLLYNWSYGFDNNKDEQRLALSMYEKAIEMDQCFMRDVINNWTRKYVKFESGLKNVIVWYGCELRSKNVLNYADLIETYFANCREKVRRARLLSNSVPLDWFVVSLHKKDAHYCGKKARYRSFVSVRKPAKYNKKLMLDRDSLKRTYSEYGIVLGGWHIESPILDTNDIAAFNYNYNSIDDVKETKFNNECVAKLIYFLTFMCDDKSVLNDVGLELDVTIEFKVLMIKLLIHYCWKLDYVTWYRNIIDAIEHSHIMTKMVNDFIKNINDRFEKDIDDNADKIWTLKRIGEICYKIEKIVDLNSQDCNLKMARVFEPKIVCRKGDFNSILSINGNDMSRLFKNPINLRQEIEICNLKLNALHYRNYINTNGKKFTQWFLNRYSKRFDIAFACCIVEMFCQIAANL